MAACFTFSGETALWLGKLGFAPLPLPSACIPSELSLGSSSLVKKDSAACAHDAATLGPIAEAKNATSDMTGLEELMNGSSFP
jgi:hypothetical protein